MLYSEKHGLLFESEAHRDFYDSQMATVKNDCYHRALIYAIGIYSDTRRNFSETYDKKERAIVRGCLNAAWQTGGSLKATRLAFNLFTDRPITAIDYVGNIGKIVEDFDECARYSVSDIFCCGYAPYFMEAIRLRYPEYMAGARLSTSKDRASKSTK